MNIETNTPSDIEVCLNRLLDRSPVERLVSFKTRWIAPPKPWKADEVHVMLVTDQSAIRVLISWEQANELMSELLPTFGQYNDPRDNEGRDYYELEPPPKKRHKGKRRRS
jgi:hypothetical protein